MIWRSQHICSAEPLVYVLLAYVRGGEHQRSMESTQRQMESPELQTRDARVPAMENVTT